MKVVGVSGSPRPKSNSSTIVKAALDELASKGAETELFEMAGMKIEGCSGCMYCKPDFSCALPAGKKAIVISTQGAPDENAFKGETEWLAETLSGYFKLNVIDKLVFVNGNDANAAAENKEFISKVKSAADKLL